MIYINIVENIIPSDDAFHGSPKRISAEWWYFDAILNNDYSIHIGFRTISRKKIGFVMPFIEIYKNGDLKHIKKKRFLLKKDTYEVYIMSEKSDFRRKIHTV